MARQYPPHIVAVPQWTLASHVLRIVLATIVLGLSAYGISYVAYNVLIYSLVVALCTIGVSIYMLVAQLATPRAYNMWAYLALQMWMVIFWLVQFSLVANLAASWSIETCSYDYWSGYSCYKKRSPTSLGKRGYTIYGAYRGALIGVSLVGAAEFISWVAYLIVFGIYLNRHRASDARSAAPPVYTPPAGIQAVPLEKVDGTVTIQPQNAPYQPPPQTAHPQYAQQSVQGAFGQSVNTGPHFVTPYTQQPDPVHREATVSPVSGYEQSTFVAMERQNDAGAAELASPQHTGGNHNAVEIGSGVGKKQ